jgi:hypothetical protein
MKNSFSILLAVILVLSCLSCGKKGDILPPLVRFPQTAEDVQISQKVDHLVLTWRNPTAYEDGSILPAIEMIEIWVLVMKTAEQAEMAAIQVEEFKEKAKLHATIKEEQIREYTAREGSSEGQMIYSFRLSGKDFMSKRYTFGLRIKDRKRYSSFSVLVSLKPMVLPLPPTGVKASVYPDRIEVTWNPPSKNRDKSSPPNVKGYNIYCSEGEGETRRLNANLIKEEKYSDTDFVFGQSYTYFVRASATDILPYLESEDSEEMEILTKDTFAPKPPEGLISVAGQEVIAISWDANAEGDLDGYRVWRRDEEATEYRLLTPDLIKENAYNDEDVEKGKMYVYAVTALDRDGNESQKSQAVSDMIRERPR